MDAAQQYHARESVNLSSHRIVEKMMDQARVVVLEVVHCDMEPEVVWNENRLDAIANRSRHSIDDGVSHFHIAAAMRESFGMQATNHAMNYGSADSCGNARINARHTACWHQRGLLCPNGTTQSALSHSYSSPLSYCS